MKKNYSVPAVEVSLVTVERNFVATAENLSTNSTYKNNYTESEFWD